MKFHLISLGCPKNLVDSEIIAGELVNKNFYHTKNINEADLIILNTCAFIPSAIQETKQHIKEISDLTTKKTCKSIFIITGCLTQLEQKNLLSEFPSVNAFVGIDNLTKIPLITKNLFLKKNKKIISEKPILQINSQPHFIHSNLNHRLISTPKSYAYLKIADGCDNRCSYCSIPIIRGNYRERPIEDIVAEAKKLVSFGTKELILISQDTTFYGMQIYKKQMLHILIKKLSKIQNLHWIRILYTNPKHFYPDLIKTISESELVCKYIDIPIQHTDDTILSLMGRTSKKQIFNTIELIRKFIPKIVLRTTVMVGFPTETQKMFENLLYDIKKLQFDWLGCFKYSRQKNTLAYTMSNQISNKVKTERYNIIMSEQQKITLKKNKSYINKIFTILKDSHNSGHAEFQSPEIDGKIFFSTKNNLSLGQLVKIKVLSLKNVYDLKSCVIKIE